MGRVKAHRLSAALVALVFRIYSLLVSLATGAHDCRCCHPQRTPLKCTPVASDFEFERGGLGSFLKRARVAILYVVSVACVACNKGCDVVGLVGLQKLAGSIISDNTATT